MSFQDVPRDAYYYGAIAWAAEHEIVKGYDADTFSPDQTITREQMAAIFWRYANYKKYDVSVGENTNILSYEDAASIQTYAIPAMQWACGSGLIVGNNQMLMPRAETTRAQTAAILHRFCQNEKI